MARRFDATSIAPFFTPRHVAVVGASSDEKKFGGRIVGRLKQSGFSGTILPINRSEPEVQGLKAYPSLAELPSPADLVLVAVPAGAVPDVISEAQAAGAKAAVVYAAGFGEARGDGGTLQHDLEQRLAAGSLRMIGPNCMGVRNFHPPMNGSNNSAANDKAGPIALLSQSGSFGNAAYPAFAEMGVGLSKYVSLGNMVDVAHADVIRYCGEDDNTGVIAAFIEGIPDIDALLDAVSTVSPRKPVVILKGARSPLGQRAAVSHTGALADDARVTLSLLREAGATVVDSMQELFDTTAAFAHAGGHLPRSHRTAIFAVSGGPSVVAADHCHQEGLELPPLAERLASLQPLVPSYAALGNPVEVTGFTGRKAFLTCAETLVDQDVIDSVIAISIGMNIDEFGDGMIAARAKKPVVACATNPDLARRFLDAGIPNYPSPERAVKVLRHLADRGAADGRFAPGKALAGPRPAAGVLTEAASKAYLAGFGLPVTREEEVVSAEAAVAAAARIGYPVALKVSSSAVAHKSDRGGVLLNLGDAAAVRSACAVLAGRFPGAAFLVQQMVPAGVELIVGAKRSRSTGAIVMIGIGGVFAEVLDDVVFCRAPARSEAMLAALGRLRSQRLLDGYRGQPAIDRAAVADIAARLSGVIAGNPAIAEVDLNPVIAAADGAIVVDALVRVEATAAAVEPAVESVVTAGA